MELRAASDRLHLRLAEDLGGRATPGKVRGWPSQCHWKDQETSRRNKQTNDWNENDASDPGHHEQEPEGGEQGNNNGGG